MNSKNNELGSIGEKPGSWVEPGFSNYWEAS